MESTDGSQELAERKQLGNAGESKRLHGEPFEEQMSQVRVGKPRQSHQAAADTIPDRWPDAEEHFEDAQVLSSHFGDGPSDDEATRETIAATLRESEAFARAQGIDPSEVGNFNVSARSHDEDRLVV